LEKCIIILWRILSNVVVFGSGISSVWKHHFCEFLETDSLSTIEIVLCHNGFNVFFRNFLAKFRKGILEILCCDFSCIINIKTFENGLKLIFCKELGCINGCSNKFTIIDFLVVGVIKFWYNTLNFFAWQIEICVSNSLLQFCNFQETWKVLINFFKFSFETVNLGWPEMLDKHVHGSFFQKWFASVIFKIIDDFLIN